MYTSIDKILLLLFYSCILLPIVKSLSIVISIYSCSKDRHQSDTKWNLLNFIFYF